MKKLALFMLVKRNVMFGNTKMETFISPNYTQEKLDKPTIVKGSSLRLTLIDSRQGPNGDLTP